MTAISESGGRPVISLTLSEEEAAVFKAALETHHQRIAERIMFRSGRKHAELRREINGVRKMYGLVEKALETSARLGHVAA